MEVAVHATHDEYPMKAQRNLRVLKEFDRMSVLDPDMKIRA